jgi:hypothetical protein
MNLNIMQGNFNNLFITISELLNRQMSSQPIFTFEDNGKKFPEPDLSLGEELVSSPSIVKKGSPQEAHLQNSCLSDLP